MYSLFINHSSIVHFQSYSRRKRPTLCRGLGTNNEHLAFLDIGCECGVMKYAFLHYENLRSTRTLDLLGMWPVCACSKTELGGGNVWMPQKYTSSQQFSTWKMRPLKKEGEVRMGASQSGQLWNKYFLIFFYWILNYYYLFKDCKASSVWVGAPQSGHLCGLFHLRQIDPFRLAQKFTSTWR